MDNNQSPNTDLLSEVEFLRQTVFRLNAKLSKYQNENVSNVDGTTDSAVLPGSGVETQAAWLYKPTLVSPLIHEYETQLSSLESKNAALVSHNEASARKIKDLTEENEQLQNEVKDLVQQQMNEIESTDAINSPDDVILKNLQTQLELTTKEKDTAVEMNRKTMLKLDEFRKQCDSEVSKAQLKEKHFDEIKSRNDHLQDANLQMQMYIESLQKENQTLTLATDQQLKDIKKRGDVYVEMKQKFIESAKKEEDHRMMITGLNKKIESLVQERSELEQKLSVKFSQNQQLETSLVEAEMKLTQALQAASDGQSQADALKVRLTTLEKINAEIERKEMDYLMQIRESAQLLDDAILTRDSALMREKQAKDDMQKASVAMETLVHEVADRVKSEVDKVKTISNANIRRLMDEVESLELEAANLRSDADRAKREKRSVEEEMGAMSRQKDESKDAMRIEELQRRTLNAERARDDSLITVQKLEEHLKRIEMNHDDERLRLLSSNQTLEERVKRLERDVEQCQHERLHLLESLNQCKHENQKLEEISKSARLNAMKEFTSQKDALVKQKKQLEIRLKCMDETNKTSVKQLHKMLADQQRITARWKEESKSACERYEDKMKDLQAQLSQNRRRCQDLTNKLKLNDVTDNQSNQRPPRVQDNVSASENTKNIPVQTGMLEETNRQLRARLHETEYKLLSATQRLGEAQTLKNSSTFHDLL